MKVDRSIFHGLVGLGLTDLNELGVEWNRIHYGYRCPTSWASRNPSSLEISLIHTRSSSFSYLDMWFHILQWTFSHPWPHHQCGILQVAQGQHIWKSHFMLFVRTNILDCCNTRNMSEICVVCLRRSSCLHKYEFICHARSAQISLPKQKQLKVMNFSWKQT